MNQKASLKRKIVAGILASGAAGLASFVLGTSISVIPLLWIERYTTLSGTMSFITNFGLDFGFWASLFGTVFAAIFGHLSMIIFGNQPRLQIKFGAFIGALVGVLHYHFDVMRHIMDERLKYGWDAQLELVLAVCIGLSGAFAAIIFFTVRNNLVQPNSESKSFQNRLKETP